MIAPSSLPPAPERAESLDLRRAWTAVARNRWLAAAVLAACVGLAVLVTVTAAPVYESEATVAIDEDDGAPMLLRQLSPLSGMNRGRIETDMLVLRSRTLAERVVDSLGMQVRLSDPSLPRASVFTRAVGSDAEASGMFVLSRAGDGYRLQADDDQARAVRGLPARVRPGVPFRIGGLTLELSAAAPERVQFQVAPLRRAVRDLRDDVGVARPNREARLVHVRYRSTDPLLAARVPNALTDAFITYTSTGSKTESRSTVDFLREQVGRYETDLRDAEARLRAFREASEVVDLQAEAGEQVKRMAALRAERDELLVERDGLAQVLVRAGRGRAEDFRQLASFPTFLSNKAVQDILQALTALENERLALLQRRQSDNPDVQGVTERIENLQGQLSQLARGYLQSLDARLVSLDEALARFGAVVGALPAREVEFARLRRQQELLEEIYTLLQTRLKESEIELAVESSEIRIIDAAVPAIEPVSPRPVLNLFLGGVLGLMLAGLAVFLRESLNTRIRGNADVTAATGGLPVLATIPRIRAVGTAGNGHGRGVVRSMSPAEMLEARLVMRRDPGSPVAEAYRALRTSISFAGPGNAPRLVVLTSSVPGEGKSTSASNLAISMALQGTRTLLVDADLRRGVLHQVLGVPQAPGLSHVLHLGTPLAEAVRQVRIGEDGRTVDFLASGAYPPNPAEMLASPAMEQLLAELRTRYEMVIFDAPPVHAVTDAALLGARADLVVLVARAGVTDRRALDHTMARLRQVGVSPGGVVLNDATSGTEGYYAYGYGENGKH